MTIDKKKIPIASVRDPYDVYGIMRTILSLPDKPDLHKRNLWTISLDMSCAILHLELVAMCSYPEVAARPGEILSLPIQKAAHKIILVHNSPSGLLTPTKTDLYLTDRLIQVGNIVNIEVSDHLIISPFSYYSFESDGLMEKLRSSISHLTSYDIENHFKKKLKLLEKQSKMEVKKSKKAGIKLGETRCKLEIAKAMVSKGFSIEDIELVTGLSHEQIA